MKTQYDLRTQNLNLLICKVHMEDENQIFLDIKNGKKQESIPLESFFAEISRVAAENGRKLNMVIS